MKISNMRWGYDGGCGMMEGTTMVETEVTDEAGKTYFLMCSRMDEFCKMEIAEKPMFDIMMDEDLDEALAKVEKLKFENYDFNRESDDPEHYDEEDEIPHGMELYPCPEMMQSRFADAIRVTLKAMEACYEFQKPADADAKLFVEEYLDKELSEMNIAF